MPVIAGDSEALGFQRIEEDAKTNERDKDFLCWLPQPEEDLDLYSESLIREPGSHPE